MFHTHDVLLQTPHFEKVLALLMPSGRAGKTALHSLSVPVLLGALLITYAKDIVITPSSWNGLNEEGGCR